jgi:hypothetical protein
MKKKLADDRGSSAESQPDRQRPPRSFGTVRCWTLDVERSMFGSRPCSSRLRVKLSGQKQGKNCAKTVQLFPASPCPSDQLRIFHTDERQVGARFRISVLGPLSDFGDSAFGLGFALPLVPRSSFRVLRSIGMCSARFMGQKQYSGDKW